MENAGLENYGGKITERKNKGMDGKYAGQNNLEWKMQDRN